MSALNLRRSVVTLVLAALFVCAGGDAWAKRKRTRAAGDDDDTPGQVSASGDEPRGIWKYVTGIHAEALGGFFSVRSSIDPRRAFVDAFVGGRVGYRRQLGPIILGGEGIFRVSQFSHEGAGTILLGQLALGGGKVAHQGIRQANQASLGGTLAYRIKRLDWFLEPFATAGISHSFRTFLVQLDSPILFNRSYPALGVYAGMGFMTGLEPVFVRMDAVINPEVGPPPFTTRLLQAQYNIGIGFRL